MSTLDASPRRSFLAIASRDDHLPKQCWFFAFVLAISALLAVVSPQKVLGAEYLAGIIALALITVLTATWHMLRVRPGAAVWIPIADILAVAPLRDAFRVEAATVTLLAFVPALWAAYSWRYVGAAASTVAVTISFAIPTLLRAYPDPTGAAVVRSVLLALVVLQMTLMIAMATTRSVQESHRSHEALRQKTELLRVTTEQENLFQNVIDSLSVGIVIVDKDGHDLMMNRAQMELHRLALPEDEPDPAEDQLLVHYPDTGATIPPHLRPVRRAVDQETFTNYIVVLGDAGGERRTVSTAARQIVDTKGQRGGAVIVFNDISTFTEHARQQRRITADVSHEMRTPLTSILGYLELAMDDPRMDPNVRNELAVVERNAEQLLHLVGDLLDGMSPHAAERSLDRSPARLGDIACEACTTLRPRAQSEGVQLTCTVDENRLISLDTARMTQVLVNLISNALKFTPSGGHVDVTVAEVEGAVEAQVKDNGIGMTPDEQANLFTEYYRTATAAKKQIPGHGLGLAITQSIVRAHGGQISVRSEPGQGSAFTIRMPVAEV
ncbi:ATP-binding protein [Brachybacterium sp. ACRRE]|uniref:ATP-binding protein n=1 Tax=Brachybacterium sp. ACRRE TaxID=2918184 RepID=UPI001EF38805|nr:ATP-binding protein [Brachybacterium sp. ACRRE]MCG7309415.1 ATP-binding protein [Brachybacterium sp. ACRRE]